MIRLENRSVATTLLVALSVLATQLAFMTMPDLVASWNNRLVDRLFRMRQAIAILRPPPNATVVHLDLTERGKRSLGLDEDPSGLDRDRSIFADTIRRVAQAGATSQVWDFVFAKVQDPATATQLAEAVTDAGNVHMGTYYGGSGSRGGSSTSSQAAFDFQITRRSLEGGASKTSGWTTSYDALARAAAGHGFVNIQPDSDGVIRRIALVQRRGDALVPSLALRAVCDYLDVTPDRVEVKPRAVTLVGAALPGQAPRDLRIPLDRRGRMVLNFSASWGHETAHYDLAELTQASSFEAPLWREALQDKIVVVSDVSTGFVHLGSVPVDENYPVAGLHAVAIENILTESFLKTFHGWRAWLAEVCLFLAVAGLAARYRSMRFLAVAVAVVGVVILALLAAFFAFGVVPGVVRPLAFLGAAIVAVVAFDQYKAEVGKAVLQRSFEAYFSPEVARSIVDDPDRIQKGGKAKELTILFSDIQGFTPMSANMSANDVRRLLNEYFEEMVEVVFRHQGTVDKFIGDGLMVFFGDPEPQPDHPLRAVKTALEMQERIAELRPRWQREFGVELHVRIGVSTGEVVVGNMGSSKRLAYTVLGANVNLAQRLEAACTPGRVLISEATATEVEGEISIRLRDLPLVKGLGAVRAYEVDDGGDSAPVETKTSEVV